LVVRPRLSPPEPATLSLHDALPICTSSTSGSGGCETGLVNTRCSNIRSSTSYLDTATTRSWSYARSRVWAECCGAGTCSTSRGIVRYTALGVVHTVATLHHFDWIDWCQTAIAFIINQCVVSIITTQGCRYAI